jgi:hypothetical protein
MSLETLKTAGFVNLSYCVNMFLVDREDFSERLREKATQYAIKILSNYNLFQSRNIEVAYLAMDSNGIVSLSSLTDYVDYTKIGIIIRGKLWILSVNEKIALRRDEMTESEALEIFNGNQREDVYEGYYFAGHYYNGIYLDTLYGYGGGFAKSYFRYDNENREFQFDTAVPNTKVVIEYLSSGVKLTGATVIPLTLTDYITFGIHERFAFFDKTLTRGERADFKQRFLEEENLATDFEFRFDLNKYLDMSYASQHQGAKR